MKGRRKIRDLPSPLLPWTPDATQLNALLGFIENAAFDVLCTRLKIKKANAYGIEAAGEIVAGESTKKIRAMPEISQIAHSYGLMDSLLARRKHKQPLGNYAEALSAHEHELRTASDCLFLLSLLRAAIKKNDAEEAAQIMARLWIVTTVWGWTAKFYPVANGLLAVNDAQSSGGTQSGAARKKTARDAAIRKLIQSRLDAGETYNSVIKRLSAPENWRSEWGECPGEGRLRNTFSKKSFT